jgi:tetratricopeptide (TPR) repeat protein
MLKIHHLDFKPRQAVVPWLVSLLCLFLASCHYFESEQVKLKKARKFYDENRFNQSIFMAKSILQSDSKSCEARILLGKSQFAKFSLLDAQDSFDKAKSQGCKDPEQFYFSVKIQLYRNRLAQAKAMFADPQYSYALKEPQSQLLKAELYFLQHSEDNASKAYSRYYELTHDAASDCLAQAKLLAIKNKYQEVIDKTQDCEKEYAGEKSYDANQSRYLRAIAQVNLKYAKKAVTTLNSIIENYTNPKDPNIKIQSSILLMKLYLAKKDVENAARMADVVLKYIAIPDVYYAKGLKAEQDNRYDLAEQQFLAALKLNAKYRPALLELANIKFKEDNVEQAKYYTGKADALSGKNIFTERLDELLAIKYLRAGDLDSIINKLPHNKSSGSLKSQYILALAYAKRGQRNKAWEVFHDIESHLSDNEKSDLLAARLHAALQDFAEAERIFLKYATMGNDYAITGLSQLYMQEHKYGQAEKLLTNALAKNENKYNTTLLLAQLYSMSNQKQKLFKLLNNSIKAEPGNQNYKLVLAKTYYKYTMYQDAIRLCTDIIKENQRNITAYIIKANSYIRLKKNGDATATFTELLKNDAKNAYAYLMLAFLADKDSKHDAAMRYIDKSLEINPRYLNAVYAKIGFLIEQKKSDDALEFAKSASKQLKQEQVKELLLAFAYNKIGDDKHAYLHYKAALENGNQDVRIALKTYKLSARVNGVDTANKELDRFLKKNPNVGNIFYVANYFMKAQDHGQAEKYYELFVKLNQTNAIAYNNLAWLKLHSGDNTAALDYAEKALTLAPSSAAIMDTMGQVLLRTGDYDKAGSYLHEAYLKLGDNPSVKYHLALFYYHKNNLKKSRELLLQIQNTKFDELAAAKELLAKIGAH